MNAPHDPSPPEFPLQTEQEKYREKLQQEISAHQATKAKLEQVIKSYSRFLPLRLLQVLHKESVVDLRLGDQTEQEMTILFSDIRDFTSLSEGMTPQQNFSFINTYLSHMEPIIFKNRGIIDKFIGDAIMALFPQGADQAVEAAIQMLNALKKFNRANEKEGRRPVKIGIGLNTGISMLGTVGGANKMEGTVISDAVNLASRLESLTKTYGVPLLISEHTLFSLENINAHGIRFIDRVLVKGKSRPQSVYEIFDADPKEIRTAKRRTLQLFEEALAFYHYKHIDEAEPLLAECLKVNPSDRPARIYLARCQTFRQTGHHDSTGELDMTSKWKPEYNVGLPEIDHQHMELLAQINRLSAAVNQERKKKEISEVIGFLDQYVHVHFNTEEYLMKKEEYPFLLEHCRQHKVFYQYFKRLKDEIEKMGHKQIFLSFRVQVFLVDWLINHSTKTDKHLGKWLREKRTGS